LHLTNGQTKHIRLTRVWRNWRFSAPQTHLWLIKHLFSASTFVAKIGTFAKPENIGSHFMRGLEILQGHVGHKLQDGLVQSFYLNSELVALINVTFLKFDNKWIRVVSTDEITTIKWETDDIENIKFYGDEEFKYPIQPIRQFFPDFNKYINKRLIDFKELVLKKSEFMSFGENLYFEDYSNFIIMNHDYPADKNEYFFEKTEFVDLREI